MLIELNFEIALTLITRMLFQFQNGDFNFHNLYLNPQVFLISHLRLQCSQSCSFWYQQRDSITTHLSFMKVRWHCWFLSLFLGLNLPHIYLQHISTIPSYTETTLTKVPIGLRPYLALCSILPQLHSAQAHSPLLVSWFSYWANTL